MPAQVKRIATTYLNDPAEVMVAAKTTTNTNIRQRYWLVSGMHKLDALTRILEAEPFDGMIIFSRTKIGTEELAERLLARGFSAGAINGDMQQAARERMIGQLKEGKIDILVATDVAARGLDVERISHVVNYDVPYDPESYTHRIGRTGRAGRSGEAILFITPRERNLLKLIERTTRQAVTPMTLPTLQAVNDVRVQRFKDQITDALSQEGLSFFETLVSEYESEHNIPAVEIAAALAMMACGGKPLLIDKSREKGWHEDGAPRQEGQGQGREAREPRESREPREPREPRPKKERIEREAEPGKATYRVEVGYQHGVKPGNIVGAIANEGGIDSKFIGRIEIYDDYSLLDMPADLQPSDIETLQALRVAGQPLRLHRDGETPPPAPAAKAPRAAKPERAERAERPERAERAAPPLSSRADDDEPMFEEAPKRKKKDKDATGEGGAAPMPMRAYRVEVGSGDGVNAGNLIGAIANESGLESRFIGRIEIPRPRLRRDAGRYAGRYLQAPAQSVGWRQAAENVAGRRHAGDVRQAHPAEEAVSQAEALIGPCLGRPSHNCREGLLKATEIFPVLALSRGKPANFSSFQ